MRNAQLTDSFAAENADGRSDNTARIVGIVLSAVIAATFWTVFISVACNAVGLQAETSMLQGIAIVIVTFVSLAMAAFPASE